MDSNSSPLPDPTGALVPPPPIPPVAAAFGDLNEPLGDRGPSTFSDVASEVLTGILNVLDRVADYVRETTRLDRAGL